MKLVRSWPLDPPDDHPLIIDNSEKVFIPTVDYRPLADLEEDFIHLDWDIAIGRDELIEFAYKCLENPTVVRSIPYRTYPTRRKRNAWAHQYTTEWCAWKYTDTVHKKRRILTGEPFCDLVGFGAIYVPVQLFKDYANQEESDCTDFKFSEWYCTKISPRGITLDWDIPIVHLNYSIKEVLRGIEQ